VLLMILQVLQLVCKECGKPCRSETEKQMHMQRNPGHTEYVDATAGAGPVDYTIKKDGTRDTSAAQVHSAHPHLFLPRTFSFSSHLLRLLRGGSMLTCTYSQTPWILTTT